MEKSNNSKKFWKSLRDYYSPDELEKLKQDEFLEETIGEIDLKTMPLLTRRRFLALLSASSAFAFTACTNYKDKGEIVPYNKKPEEITIGKANYYATTLNCCSNYCSVLVKTREGRPIKIDGNPDHPINQGKVCIRGQASILNLYDPDRIKKPLEKVSANGFVETRWLNVNKKIIQALKNSVLNNKEIAFVTNRINSPSTYSLLKNFIEKYPTTKIYSYELFSNQLKKLAWKETYGSTELPQILWQKANVILSIDGDFLGTEGNVLEQIRKFTEKRNVNRLNDFNRLYVVEGNLSISGINADYRIRLRPDFIDEFLYSLINEVQTKLGKKVSLPFSLNEKIAKASLTEFVQRFGLKKEVIEQLVTDLISNQGKSIVYGGNKLGKNEHILVNLLNELLGNSQLYNYSIREIEFMGVTYIEEIRELSDKMRRGEVGVFINFDSNPVYHFPQFKFAEALSKVDLAVSLCEQRNETAEFSSIILPIHNDLESWNDYQIRTDVINLQQPVIAPIYDTRQKEAILLTWVTEEPYYDSIYQKYLKKRWQNEIYPKLNPISDFDSFWFASLHDGFVELKREYYISQKFELKEFIVSFDSKKEDFLLQVVESYHLGDGKFANNGWLQEVPHPISKVVWDNYAAISPTTAKQLNLEIGDVIEVKSDEYKLEMPVWIQAGLADNFVCVESGYGREICGEVGKDVGVNVNKFISKSSNYQVYVKISKTGKKYKIVSAQEHHSLDDAFVKDFHRKRDIILEGTLLKYQKEKDFIQKERPELVSIVNPVEYKDVKWAMAIDLNKCIGCNACVVSCISENNIPMVGKEQVEKGREMHWIRIDTYYSGTPEDVIVSNQPMLCQHCDNAPCENVCPVAATNHSPDGLNQMAYNRCVGTRYCANNCPYKVRRFNFLDFRSEFENEYQYQEPLSLLQNPEVTVRSRGVMEKCTFCIQRIMEARERAVERGETFNGNGVMTACQQACPANAITFGNMLDAKSEVSKQRKHDLTYYVLEETNVKPNVAYIAKLRNINSEEIL